MVQHPIQRLTILMLAVFLAASAVAMAQAKRAERFKGKITDIFPDENYLNYDCDGGIWRTQPGPNGWTITLDGRPLPNGLKDLANMKHLSYPVFVTGKKDDSGGNKIINATLVEARSK